MGVSTTRWVRRPRSGCSKESYELDAGLAEISEQAIQLLLPNENFCWFVWTILPLAFECSGQLDILDRKANRHIKLAKCVREPDGHLPGKSFANR